MKLTQVTHLHFSEILRWVNTEKQLLEWAGPNVRYPTNARDLELDVLAQSWPTFALVSEVEELIGFGQYYLRLDHCHVCRLIVSPTHRGKGVVRQLIELISAEGTRQLDVSACSLFVYQDNTAAIKAYEKMGFIGIDYPTDDAIAGCLYMVKPCGDEVV